MYCPSCGGGGGLPLLSREEEERLGELRYCRGVDGGVFEARGEAPAFLLIRAETAAVKVSWPPLLTDHPRGACQGRSGCLGANGQKH